MKMYDHTADILIYAAGCMLSFEVLGQNAVFAVPVFAAFLLVSIWYGRRADQRRLSHKADLSSQVVLAMVKNAMEHTGRGLMSSVRGAGRLIWMYDHGLADVLREAMQRVCLGYGMDGALGMQAIPGRARYRYIESLGGMLNGTDSATAVREAHLQAEMGMGRAREDAMGSLQRYASVNMAVGTVVPSFITFGFVGYSMMSGGSMAAFAFMISFGAVLPLAMKVIKSKMGEMHERI